MNGGRKEDFEDLTEFDIALIRITHESYAVRQMKEMAELFSKIFGGDGG